MEEWKIIFYIVASYTIFSGVFFLIFGTGPFEALYNYVLNYLLSLGETLEWGRGVSNNKSEESQEMEECPLKSIEITLDH